MSFNTRPRARFSLSLGASLLLLELGLPYSSVAQSTSADVNQEFLAALSGWMSLDSDPAWRWVRLIDEAGEPAGSFLIRGDGRLEPAGGADESSRSAAQWLLRYFGVPAACSLEMSPVERVGLSSEASGSWSRQFWLTLDGIRIRGWRLAMNGSGTGQIEGISGDVPRVPDAISGMRRERFRSDVEVEEVIRGYLDSTLPEGWDPTVLGLTTAFGEKSIELEPLRAVWRGMAGQPGFALMFTVDLIDGRVVEAGGMTREHQPMQVSPFEPGELP